MFDVSGSLTITSNISQKTEGERIEFEPRAVNVSFLEPLYPLVIKDSQKIPEELRDFLNGKTITVQNNQIHVTLNNRAAFLFVSNYTELVNRMFFDKNPLVRFKERYKRLQLKIEVLPESILYKHVDYKNDLVTFATRVTLLTKVPHLTLTDLQKPFKYGYGFSKAQIIAAIAMIEHGDALKKILVDDDDLFWGYPALVNREYYESHPIEFYTQRYFDDTPSTATGIIVVLNSLDFSHRNWEILCRTSKNLKHDFDFKCTSLSRFLQDMRDMCRAMQKGIRRIENMRDGEHLSFHKYTSQHHGLVSFECDKNNASDILTKLNDSVTALQQIIAVTEQQVLPVEKSLGHEFDRAKPFRRMIATIAKYLFNKIELDPALYADHVDEFMRNYARMLIT